MTPRITAHIECGTKLKQCVLDTISSWQYDQETDTFPKFILGEPHALGDLESDVERWFNEAEVLTRNLLNSEHTKRELGSALSDVRHPWFNDWIRYREGKTTRTQTLETIEENFTVAIRALRTVPNMSLATQGPMTEALPVSINSAFILMWMDPQRPELEDVSNAFKDVFENLR